MHWGVNRYISELAVESNIKGITQFTTLGKSAIFAKRIFNGTIDFFVRLLLQIGELSNNHPNKTALTFIKKPSLK